MDASQPSIASMAIRKRSANSGNDFRRFGCRRYWHLVRRWGLSWLPEEWASAPGQPTAVGVSQSNCWQLTFGDESADAGGPDQHGSAPGKAP